MAATKKTKKKAAPKKVEEVVEEVVQEPQVEMVEVVEEKVEEPEITVEKPVNNKPAKLHTIKVKQYTRVFIGEWYTFEPNKVYRVEIHVKDKLQNAGLLAPVQEVSSMGAYESIVSTIMSGLAQDSVIDPIIKSLTEEEICNFLDVFD